MTNNDILIRLRYALDIKDMDMVQIFKLGGVDVTLEEVKKMLTKPKDDYDYEDIDEDEDFKRCTNETLEKFLNGLITFKRGPKPGQTGFPPLTREHMNNQLLKKVKIALVLTSEDIIDIIAEAGVTITKGEVGALLRKEGHKNYKECGDKYARNFLKGLAIKYRG
ncbi:DUF1456 family protein [Sutcliffiella cohnii]|uniref:Cytoplasmic protein n=1 Tax=Sutcliffiella cohnii TaxID=33932 RepID=A0A223KK24_9BACI|nr:MULTISPECIES: DUF1456 family protein [Sutcliffiella]AST89831.1 cytoplasmic protein [Sutcliffiella cohnii]WBL15456.1 DUF1456 family protein [Sutcliffiella sp. NC1]